MTMLRTSPPLPVHAAVTSLALGLIGALAGSSGCGSHSSSVRGSNGLDLDARPVVVEHEPCDLSSSSVQKVDANGDGKSDIVMVFKGGREVCRAVDLNHDGREDRFLYFDAQGQVRRTESDYDRDGRIDEIGLYQGGGLVRKYRAMSLNGKLDTWDIYENGQLARRERDSEGDGHVDQWWTFPDKSKPECPMVIADKNGDGKPDMGSQVNLCATEGEPASILAPTTSASAATSSSTPPVSSVTSPPPVAPALAAASASAAASAGRTTNPSSASSTNRKKP